MIDDTAADRLKRNPETVKRLQKAFIERDMDKAILVDVEIADAGNIGDRDITYVSKEAFEEIAKKLEDEDDE